MSDELAWLIWRHGQRYAGEYFTQQYLYGWMVYWHWWRSVSLIKPMWVLTVLVASDFCCQLTERSLHTAALQSAISYGIAFLCARSSGTMDNKFTLSFLFTTTHPRLCRAGQWVWAEKIRTLFYGVGLASILTLKTDPPVGRVNHLRSWVIYAQPKTSAAYKLGHDQWLEDKVLLTMVVKFDYKTIDMNNGKTL